ncbi:GGDEF domain-containing protein, partial [Actinoplanes philippinensis]
MTADVAVRDLTADVTRLESSSSIDELVTVRQRATGLRGLAVAAGDDEAVRRCDLIIADVLVREGHLGPGGHSARDSLEWAEQRGNLYVQARAHRVLSNFYRLLGDFSESLAHGVQAVSTLPAGAAPGVRARHLLMLGCSLDDNGSYDESDVRYREVLRISGDTGDDGLALRALNNLAYNAYERGDEPTATALTARMREVAARGRGLAAKELDTIARVEMMAGRFAALEDTLAGVLAGAIVDPDGDGLAECLLTLAEARRLNGRPEAAQIALDRTAELCERSGLARAAVQMRREQAALFAATDRFRDAYEELL